MFVGKMIKYFIVALICSVLTCPAAPMRLTMVMEHEGFLMWYAQQKGWDKEIGLDLKLEITKSSGEVILKKDNAKDWDVTSVGIVPVTIYSKNLPLTVFALANNESRATEIFVKPDSEILKTRGYNSKYPSVYGSPESIKGKTFMVRENTSVFYTLMMWLKIFGLELKDVNYIDITIPKMVKKFKKSKADGFVIWSPDSYEAIRQGYVQAASVEQMHVFLPMVFCAHNEYAENHAEELGKLVYLYSRACHEQVRRHNPSEMIKAYQKFLKIYAGISVNETFCKFDLLRHAVLSLDEQLEYFREDNGVNKISEARNNILSLYRESISSPGRNDSYEEKDYPITFSDRYLIEAKKYQSPSH